MKSLNIDEKIKPEKIEESSNEMTSQVFILYFHLALIGNVVGYECGSHAMACIRSSLIGYPCQTHKKLGPYVCFLNLDNIT